MASRPQLALNDIKSAFLPPLSRSSCFPPKDPDNDHDPLVIEVGPLVSHCSMIPRQWLGLDGPSSQARHDADLMSLLSSMKGARFVVDQSSGAYFTYYPFEDRAKQADVELVAGLDRVGIKVTDSNISGTGQTGTENDALVRYPLLYHVLDASPDEADFKNGSIIESMVADFERVFLVCLVQSAFPFPKLEVVASRSSRRTKDLSLAPSTGSLGSCAPWYVQFMYQVYQRVQRNVRRFYYINDKKNPYKVPFRPRKYLVEEFWQLHEQLYEQRSQTRPSNQEIKTSNETTEEYDPDRPTWPRSNRPAHTSPMEIIVEEQEYQPESQVSFVQCRTLSDMPTPYSPTYSPIYSPTYAPLSDPI